MAIRDRFRRALNKSGDVSLASTASSSQNDITVTTTTTTTSSNTSNDSSNSLHSQHSRLFPWRSRDSDDKRERKPKKGKPVHPRDKPLTPMNIQHQQMLGQFTMTFGSSPNRMSQLCLPDLGFDGVSPCCTRTPSIINSDAISADVSRLDITER